MWINTHPYTYTHTSVEHATVEKVVQETCYEVVFDDGSVCSSLPASQIIKVRIQLQFIMAWMFTDVYIVCVCVCVCACTMHVHVLLRSQLRSKAVSHYCRPVQRSMPSGQMGRSTQPKCWVSMLHPAMWWVCCAKDVFTYPYVLSKLYT